MVSINEVAAMAGVSKATVSRVVNNNGYVSEKTRKKIEKVIQEMRYVPSASAVSLSKGVTNAIGVVVPEIDNTFYGEVLRGIIDVADQHDIQLFFYDTQNNAKKEEKVLQMISRQQLMGLIIAPSVDYSLNIESRKMIAAIDRLNVPVVIVDRDFENIRWDGVFFENYQSAYAATTELIKAGNRRLGVITGGKGLKISRDRYHGFEQAVADHGLELLDRDVMEGDFFVEGAYELARKMFLSGDWPEGILTCNNRTSIGFLKAAKECSIQVGRDIALIGIDKLPILDEIGFPLSCASRDNHEMGCMALKLMLERMRDEKSSRKISMVPYQIELKGTEKRSG